MDRMQATLARARRAALSRAQKAEADDEKPSLDEIAEEAARRHEAEERRRAEENQGGEGPSSLLLHGAATRSLGP